MMRRWPRLRSQSSRQTFARSTTACGRASTRRAAQGKLQAWAAYDYSSTDLQAGPTNGSATHEHRRGRRSTSKGLRPACWSARCSATPTKGRFRRPGRRIHAAPAGRHRLRGLRRRPVVRRRDARRRQPLDYSDITRVDSAWARLLRTESADARGYELTGRILGGYWFTMKDLIHGPYARLAWTKVRRQAVLRKELGQHRVDATTGSRATQLLWSLGWQVAGNIGGFPSLMRGPPGRSTRTIRTRTHRRLVGLAGRQLRRPASRSRDNSYALFSLGASAPSSGGVTGFIAGSATASRSDGNYWAITVGLRMPLAAPRRRATKAAADRAHPGCRGLRGARADRRRRSGAGVSAARAPTIAIGHGST